MLKKLLLSVVWVFWVGYSYSESITPYYGTSGNAAANGLTWSMDNVFPDSVPGVDVNLIIYNYTIQKDVNDQVDVYVQNENALGSGYIFREHDEWRPGSLGGTQINKAVPVIPNIPRAAWGDGEIAVEGNGSVTDPNVIYNYRVDPCFDPQFDENCPGYVPYVPEIPEVDVTTIYDATDGDAEIAQVDTDEVYKEEDEEKSDKEKEEEEEEEEKDREERLEKALAAAESSAMFAQSQAQAMVLASVNAATNITSYYTTTIPGGVYRESVVLVDTKLPENKRGLRNGLAQQLLHNKMVDMQYE